MGGEEATKGAAPHMAALVVSEYITMLVCGASIVSRRHLLTAAHCVDIFVISGELLQSYHAIIGTNDWFHKGTDARISKFYMHLQYNPHAIKHDFAVLQLEKSLTLSDKVGVITLNYKWVGGEEQAIVTGWGRLQVASSLSSKIRPSFQAIGQYLVSKAMCQRPAGVNCVGQFQNCRLTSKSVPFIHQNVVYAMVTPAAHWCWKICKWALPPEAILARVVFLMSSHAYRGQRSFCTMFYRTIPLITF